MTPKEKAKELINKFSNAAFPVFEDFTQIMAARACALIAVNELILLADKTDKLKPSMMVSLYGDQSSYVKYWQQVKEEIEKL